MKTHFSSTAVSLIATGVFSAALLYGIFPVSSSPRTGKAESGVDVAATERIVVVPLTTNDLIYDPADAKLYVSVPSAAGPDGNSLRSVDPSSLAIGAPVFVGSEPNKLAMSADGQSIYVGLDGAFSVRKFDTVTQTAGLQFSTQFDSTGRFRISDMVVAPDNPSRVAIARSYVGVSPPGAGVAVFDNGVRLTLTTPGHSDSSDFLSFADGSTLYGTGQFSGLKTMTVNANGVIVASSATVGSGSRIKSSGGKLFTSSGQVIDPATATLLGTFPGAASNAFVPDALNGRSYYLVKDTTLFNTWVLKAFNNSTFSLAGSLVLTNVLGDASSLVRWGSNGLAFRTTQGQLYIIQTSLIPSPDPIPGPTANPTPIPSPSSTPFETSTNFVPVVGKDVVFNASSQKLYVSLPSSAGANGNSVARVDPTTATLENSTWVGSEPNKLALSSNGQTLYVGLDGAREIRTLATSTDTLGPQFRVGSNGFDGPLRIVDFSASPDDPNMIAVTTCSTVSFPCNRGATIFDSGTPRAQTRGDGNSIDFSNTSSTLFGASSSGGLEVMTVGTSGITGYSKMPFKEGPKIEFGNGRVYSSSGQVIDPVTQNLTGAFDLTQFGVFGSSFVLDAAHNRIYYLIAGGQGLQIKAFDTETFLLTGSISIPNYTSVVNAVLWGSNGLAVTGINSPLLIVQSKLFDPNISVPVSNPSPTPVPSSTPVPAFVRRVNQLANNLVGSTTEGRLYISVPGTATDGTANSITRINPSTGATEASTFIGSEPSRIGFSDPGHVMWVKLDGANAIRRFDTATQMPGLQFVPQEAGAQDIEVLPGSPESIVIGTGQNGSAVYDSGIRRPNIARDPSNTVFTAWIGPIEFSNNPNLLYGYNDVSTGFDLYRVSVDANGLTTLSGFGNLISGFGNLDMKFAEGKIYTSSGRIVDPETNRIVGTFQVPGSGSGIVVDPTLRRVFILSSSNTISVFNMDTFLNLGTISFSNPNGGNLSDLVRWGANGLAFRVQNSSSDSFLYIIQSPAVDPAAPIPTGLSFATSAATVSENSVVTLNVVRSGDLSVASSVNFATADGTAIAGQDYTAAAGVIQFASGQSVQQIQVNLINDQTFEGRETFRVDLSAPTGGNSQLVFPSSTQVTINDNDPRPAIAGDDTTVREVRGGVSTANVLVHLSNPSVESVSVNYSTANGTAIAGQDYTPVNGTLTFNPLETSKTIQIAVNGDSVREANETFFVNLGGASNGSIADPQAVVTIRDSSSRRADFDGDGKTDLSVFRPSDGNWYAFQSGGGGANVRNWGVDGDVLTPGDFDGDGKTDTSAYRPSTGQWLIFRSSDSTVSILTFGIVGDRPVPGDYDGDGKTDIAQFRPSEGVWYVFRSSDNGVSITTWGEATDLTVPADYDGDGKTDVAVFRPSTGVWYVFRSTAAPMVVGWGVAGDKPVEADYDGDGKDDVAIYRPSEGNWYVFRSSDNSVQIVNWGNSTDVPSPGDYDGDGKDDFAVFRDGTWYAYESTAGPVVSTWGVAGDTSIPSKYIP